MKIQSFSETRTTSGFYITPKSHFFFDGIGFVPGTVGKGNWPRNLSGAIHGKVKVTPLRNGRISLRSLGNDGDGRLVHVNRNVKIVIDGKVTTAGFLADNGSI